MKMLSAYKMTFQGELLQRGFWLHIWSIRGAQSRHLYLGRTGDSSSPNASSPFNRIGQHLDTRPSAKGNSLAKQLWGAGVDSARCTFEMIAIGPIHAEQKTFEDHRPIRDITAALERALADELRHRGYIVLGTHPTAKKADPQILSDVIGLINSSFPTIAT